MNSSDSVPNNEMSQEGNLDESIVPIDSRFLESASSQHDNSDVTATDFSIIWHNLTYQVDQRKWYSRIKDRYRRARGARNNGDGSARNNTGKKVILDKLCGYASSRQLTAIMGPSGAGKSTLLQCLFQNHHAGATGQILVEGRHRTKLKVCFIPQKDYLNEFLTVREDLVFVSRLKSANMMGFLDSDDRSSSGGAESTSSSTASSYARQNGKSYASSLIDHEANAIRVTDLLGLSNCLDVPIKNISGGQKKRLSIARELMSNPDILVMDEPTTGLDSLTCLKTVKMLKDLARSSAHPMAIIVTIHQPQREVFNLFDKTYFISSRGAPIYDGDPKQAVQLIEKVAKLKLPVSNYNPASFLIEIAADEAQDDVTSLLRLHLLSQFYLKYDRFYLSKLVHSKLDNYKKCRPASGMQRRSSFFSDFSMSKRSKSPLSNTSSPLQEDSLMLPGETTDIKLTDGSCVENQLKINQLHVAYQLKSCLNSHPTSLSKSFHHIFILTHRSWLSFIRNPTFTRSRLAFHTLLPLLMLAVYGGRTGSYTNCPKIEAQIGLDEMARSLDEGTVRKNVDETKLSLENISFFFILLYGFGINIISTTASFYPTTMHMFKKETINGLYLPASYFIGQMLSELPLEIFFPTLSILIAYPLSGQIPSYLEWRMFTIAYIIFLVCYCMHAIGLLCGAIFVNDMSVAVLLGQVLLLPQVMLSGFLIRPGRMANWMSRLSLASPLRNGMMAILVARYGFNSCDCDEDMLAPEGGPKLEALRPNVRHVLEYMFPAENGTDSVNVVKVFEQLGDNFVKSQTFGLDLKTCEDVKPYLLHVFSIGDMDLFLSILWLLFTAVFLKLVTFSMMKSLPSRIK